MKTERSIARTVGILYIVGTVAGILSVVFLGDLYAENYLTAVAANQGKMIVGTLMVLVMGLALTFIPPLLHPIFKKHNETLSLAYLVFRSSLESITYILSIIGMLLVVTLSIVFVQAASPDTAVYELIGNLLDGADGWINNMRIIVFGISAIIISIIFYRTKLIPRWISVWGFIAAVLHITNGLFTMFGVFEMMSTPVTLMDMPIFLQEMVMAVWLIVKGFDKNALEALDQ